MTDRLGSPLAMPRVGTSNALYQAYSPWGTSTDATTWTGGATASAAIPGYTGQYAESAAGLVNMGGRMYDPAISAFLSPDPTPFSPFSIEGRNRYSYARHNPMRFVDPTGFDATGPDGDGWDLGVGGVFDIDSGSSSGGGSGGGFHPRPGGSRTGSMPRYPVQKNATPTPTGVGYDIPTVPIGNATIGPYRPIGGDAFEDRTGTSLGEGVFVTGVAVTTVEFGAIIEGASYEISSILLKMGSLMGRAASRLEAGLPRPARRPRARRVWRRCSRATGCCSGRRAPRWALTWAPPPF